MRGLLCFQKNTEDLRLLSLNWQRYVHKREDFDIKQLLTVIIKITKFVLETEGFEASRLKKNKIATSAGF